MPENPQQTNFFHNLDFPGRTVLYLWEVAQKLGETVQYYLNLIDTGELVAIDTGSRANGKTRRVLRIPNYSGATASDFHGFPFAGRTRRYLPAQ